MTENKEDKLIVNLLWEWVRIYSCSWVVQLLVIIIPWSNRAFRSVQNKLFALFSRLFDGRICKRIMSSQLFEDYELLWFRPNVNFVRTSIIRMFSQSWVFGVFGLFGLESGLKGQLWPWIWKCGLCSLCKPIVSHLYSCFGLLFELSQKKKCTNTRACSALRRRS